MLELKPFRKGVDDPVEWIEKLSRLLEDNLYFEQLLAGKLVTKHTVSTSNASVFSVNGSADLDCPVVINESGAADHDLRVEGDTDANLLFTDASADKVGIGTAAPDSKLHVYSAVAAVMATFEATLSTSYSYIRCKNNAGRLLAFGYNGTSGSENVAGAGSGEYGWITTNGNYSIWFGVNASAVMSLEAGGDTKINAWGDDRDFIVGSNNCNNSLAVVSGAHLATDSVVVNEDSADVDFRVESNTDTANIFSDASTDRVGIGTAAPDVKLDVRGVSRFGASSTNYAEFEADGTLEFNGTATVYEDLRIEPVARTTGANAPTFEKWYDDAAGTSRGVYLYSFDDAAAGSEKEVFFSMQMPHAWAGTAISLHVHWVGNVADTTAEPRWGLEYAWQDIGTDYGDTTIVYTTGAKIGAGGAADNDVTAGRHYISEFADITPSASQDGISGIIIGRLFRNSSDAGDTYNAATAKCGLLYVDAHYEVNTCGSRAEYTK